MRPLRTTIKLGTLKCNSRLENKRAISISSDSPPAGSEARSRLGAIARFETHKLQAPNETVTAK